MSEISCFEDADNAFEREIASEILEKIEEELDSANVDSAYETDYGAPVFDTETCAEDETTRNELFLRRKMDGNCKETGLGLGTSRSNNTLPASCSEVNDVKTGHKENVQEHSHADGMLTHSHADGMFTWNVQDLWGTDSCENEQYDIVGGFTAEKYKNIWSTGQDSGIRDLSEFYVSGMVCDDHQDVGCGQYEDGCQEEPMPMLVGDDFFSVKIRYKDKLRIANEEELSEQQSYGLHDLMPMPNEALFSCELEEQWLTRELPFFGESLFINPGKSSKFQRKPCSFFLEGKCRRADCKFAHDISNITCRFWEEGECFKGPLCPFLHGYPRESSPNGESGKKEKFILNQEEFPDLKTSSKSNSSGIKRSRSLRSQNQSGSASRKEKNGRKQRRHSNKETKTEAKI